MNLERGLNQLGVNLRTVVLDCRDPDSLVEFWSVALGYMLADKLDEYRVLVPAPAHDPTPAEAHAPVLVLAQVAEFAFENFGAPDWALKSFVVALLLGLPLALFFAWAFEMTPEGLKKESEVDHTQSITPHTGKKLNNLIFVGHGPPGGSGSRYGKQVFDPIRDPVKWAPVLSGG